jgi:hypothetical protein
MHLDVKNENLVEICASRRDPIIITQLPVGCNGSRLDFCDFGSFYGRGREIFMGWGLTKWGSYGTHAKLTRLGGVL